MMNTLGSSHDDLQSRIAEIKRKRLELDKKLHHKRQPSYNDEPQDSKQEYVPPISSLKSPKVARGMSPVGVSLARAKEDYIKQVTKDLPQWLILKQQKEVEEMTNLKKSVEALHESRLAIKDEMTKHMQYMKGLNEKKSELMRQHEAETYEEAMRKHQWSTLHKASPDVKPQFVPVNFGFSHRSAAEFLERTSSIADLYLPSFPITGKPRSSLRELLSEPAPSQPLRSTSSSSTPSRLAPNLSNPERVRDSAKHQVQKPDAPTQIQNPNKTEIQDPGTPEETQSASIPSDSEPESEFATPSETAPSLRHLRDAELNFSDAAAKVPRPRRDSNPRRSPPRDHITTTAVPKRLRSSLRFGSRDGKLETFKKDMHRGKANMVADTDSEVEMGSFNDSKEDEEEEEISFNAPSPTDFMRVASKESINSRYTANTSESDITDSLTSFPSGDESASDDFFISRSPHNKTRTNNIKSKSGNMLKPRRETLDDGSSASEDFFITVNKERSSKSITRGNGIISAPPVVPKSSNIVATSPGKPSPRRTRRRKDTTQERTGKDEKNTKGEKQSVKIMADSTDTEDFLAEETDNFEELREFSDVYDSSGEAPRSNRTPHAAHANSNLLRASKPANSSNSSMASSRATRPTRVLSMGPSSISLLDAKNTNPSLPDDSLSASQGLPRSPSVRNPGKGPSVKFQLSDSPGSSKGNLLAGDSLDNEDQPLHKSSSQPQLAPQRLSKKLLISTHQPSQSEPAEKQNSGQTVEREHKKEQKGKKERPIVNSLALSQSLLNSGTKIEPLDHVKALRRLVAYIERDPLDEFLYRSRSDAKLIREIKTTAEREPRQLLKYRVRDCCSALLDTIKTFPDGLLSHQFVGYLMKQDAYGEEGLLEYSSPKACEFWCVLLEHLEVLQARRLMPWNQIITVFGNTLLSNLSHLDMASKEFSAHARHEALRQFLQKDPDSNIQELEEFIGDTDLSVILALASCLESQKNSQDPSSEPEDPFIEGFSFYMVSEEARLASAFVAVWLTYRHSRNGNDELSTGRTWPLVMTVLSHEFGAVESRLKFLDGVSFGSALVAAYGRMVGRDYFRYILEQVIGMIAKDPSSIEIDLLRLKGKNANEDKKLLNKNRNHLKTACELVMEKVTSLDANYPADLADVFVHVSTLIHEHVGGDIQLANNALRRIFWDYWVCPCIAQPSMVGINVTETDPNVQRGLSILAHSMRAATLGEPTKVQHVAALTNPFIITFNSIIPMFLNPGPHGGYAPPLVDGLSREGSLREILSLLKIHFNKVVKSLQSQDTISVKLYNFLEFALTDRLKSGKKVRDRNGSMDLSVDLSAERTPLERAISFGVVDGNTEDQYEENIKL